MLTKRVVESFGSLAALAFVCVLAACSESETTGVEDDEPEPQVATLELEPDSIEFGALGERQRIEATARDSAGNVIGSAAVRWTSTAPDIVSVDANGVVESAGGGTAAIEAVAGTATASAVAVVRNRLCEGGPAPIEGAVAGPPTFSLREVDGRELSYHGGGANGASIDIGGDGVIDFVVNNGTDVLSDTLEGVVFAYRNDGTGEYVRDSLDIAPSELKGPSGFAVFDADGDGLQELLVGAAGSDVFPSPGAKNLYLEQTADGGFTDVSASRFVPHQSRSTFDFDVADIDCDGDLDVMEENQFSDNRPGFGEILVNDGGILTIDNSRLPDEITSGALQLGDPMFCDVVADGAPDLLFNGGEDPATLLVNDGFGTFHLAEDASIPDTRPDPSWGSGGSACIDANGDGLPDAMLTASPPDEGIPPRIALVLNNGDLTFTEVTETHLPQAWGEGWIDRVLVHDMNGDGWPDAVAYGAPPCLWSVFVNQGDGTFVQIDPYPQDANVCGGLFPTDVNSDGLLDLVRIDQVTPPLLLVNGGS